jgi:hypothetical protein
MNKSIFNDAQWRWAADRYRDGYTQKMLAEFLGVHRYTLTRHLQRLGVLPRSREDLPPLENRKREFMELREEEPAGVVSEKEPARLHGAAL